MKVFEQYNEDYEKPVKAGIKSPKSLNKYQAVYKHLKEFLYQRYHVSDIALKELAPTSSRTSTFFSARTSIAATIPYGFIPVRFGQWYQLPSTMAG